MKPTRRQFLIGSGVAALATQINLPAMAAAAKTGLKDAYKDRFLIGAAINTSITKGDLPDITEIIKRDFFFSDARKYHEVGICQNSRWRMEMGRR
jgi:endo-1,4-beta-xylanase